MRNPVLAAVVAAVLVLPASGARAASLNFFTSAWFFGDSLTDDGNLFAATGGKIPPDPPYYQGRSSNGPVWADHIAQDFAAENLPTENFAFAYAQAVTNDDEAIGRPLQIPDLQAQLGAFGPASAGRLGARPIATLLIGANDIFRALEIDPFAAVDAGVAAANAVADAVDTLAEFGVEDYLVFNLPPLGDAPAFAASPARPFAMAATDGYNATLAARLAEAPGVRNIDLHMEFLKLLADPEAYALENVTTPCFVPPDSLCSPEEADVYAFFDGVHPTQVVHAEIADLVREQVAPVPLPGTLGLLLAGVGGLAVVGRRGRG